MYVHKKCMQTVVRRQNKAQIDVDRQPCYREQAQKRKERKKKNKRKGKKKEERNDVRFRNGSNQRSHARGRACEWTYAADTKHLKAQQWPTASLRAVKCAQRGLASSSGAAWFGTLAVCKCCVINENVLLNPHLNQSCADILVAWYLELLPAKFQAAIWPLLSGVAADLRPSRKIFHSKLHIFQKKNTCGTRTGRRCAGAC